ncbi:VIT1/CCC1 transporter family protein [Mesobacterium pallidum]|uniref:VIT1/CCC1 transporter family protein n=1 Tax=Mesobacterium pallidum TaxID=2872037 RepID=UPI001EE1C9C4|nr:VIT1/CCC1 transporter family protein [Mesobacterium pallidum]
MSQQQSYLRDAVYGAIDGSVTTFAIVAGTAGAGLSPLVIVALGIANVLADGFSMAAGNYAGIRAEAENSARHHALTRAAITSDPEGRRAALRAHLAEKGLAGPLLDQATQALSQDPEVWAQLLLDSEGHAASGLHPMRAALTTFAAFLAAGLLPLLPFLLSLPSPFILSGSLTFAGFFLIGAIRSHWSLRRWWASGAETLLIGGIAAIIAFVVGSLFHI